MSSIATIRATGESAVRVTGTTGDRERDWTLVHKIARAITGSGIEGIITAIPTYESVLVEFDSRITSSAAVQAVIIALLGDVDLDAPLLESPRLFVVPVLYDGEDLTDVAALTGLSEEQVIEAHSSPTYVIRCLGAPGGSPMLDGPRLPVPVPRLKSPRIHVPQGAVSLAGRQATITPAAAPGGWMLIGNTPLTVLDLTAERLVPYEPGDLLRFERIDADRFAELRGIRLAPSEGVA